MRLSFISKFKFIFETKVWNSFRSLWLFRNLWDDLKLEIEFLGTQHWSSDWRSLHMLCSQSKIGLNNLFGFWDYLHSLKQLHLILYYPGLFNNDQFQLLSGTLLWWNLFSLWCETWTNSFDRVDGVVHRIDSVLPCPPTVENDKFWIGLSLFLLDLW